jgi:fructose-1,6-bisphosphatase/inositol monophosphatase family enzyme
MYLIDAVSELLAEIVGEEILPRFRRLRAADVEAKVTIGDPEDIVTIVDRIVEARLERALTMLLPGSVVVGEEGVHVDPRRLGALGCDHSVWLVDPLDGTKNFARGDDAFGTMIALHERGQTRAAWIALPARDETYVAIQEAGTCLNGRRVQVPAGCVQVPATSASASHLRGSCYTRFMTNDLAELVERRARAGGAGAGAAAVEYTGIVRGEKDFVIYHRLLPWDHAPGALVLVEAGGRVESLDGSPYRPGGGDRLTVLGRSPSVCATVRGWLGQG